MSTPQRNIRKVMFYFKTSFPDFGNYLLTLVHSHSKIITNVKQPQTVVMELCSATDV